MNEKLNNEFLEAFKRLEQLCNQIYNEHNGVSCYINDMKERGVTGRQKVVGWDNDFSTLVRLRHIRTCLSHEVGTLKMKMCDVEDIEWLVRFYDRVMNQKDPLSMLRIKTQTKRNTSQAKKNTTDRKHTDVHKNKPTTSKASSESKKPARKVDSSPKPRQRKEDVVSIWIWAIVLIALITVFSIILTVALDKI